MSPPRLQSAKLPVSKSPFSTGWTKTFQVPGACLAVAGAIPAENAEEVDMAPLASELGRRELSFAAASSATRRRSHRAPARRSWPSPSHRHSPRRSSSRRTACCVTVPTGPREARTRAASDRSPPQTRAPARHYRPDPLPRSAPYAARRPKQTKLVSVFRVSGGKLGGVSQTVWHRSSI